MEILEAADGCRLEQIEELYEKAFPACERKPFSVLLKKREEKSVEILYLRKDEAFAGLAITALWGDLVLLDYFAVAGERRGGGIGSEALGLLLERYKNKRLILEIESTEAKAPDHDMRVRRKAFYHRNKMSDLPFTVLLFGVEMEMLSNQRDIAFGEYWELYNRVFGPGASKNVKLLAERASGERPPRSVAQK